MVPSISGYSKILGFYDSVYSEPDTGNSRHYMQAVVWGEDPVEGNKDDGLDNFSYKERLRELDLLSLKRR